MKQEFSFKRPPLISNTALELPAIVRVVVLLEIPLATISQFTGCGISSVSAWISAQRIPERHNSILLGWLAQWWFEAIQTYYRSKKVEEFVKEWATHHKIKLHPRWKLALEDQLTEARDLLIVHQQEVLSFLSTDFAKAIDTAVNIGVLKDEKLIRKLRDCISEDPQERVDGLFTLLFDKAMPAEAKKNYLSELSKAGISPTSNSKKPSKKKGPKRA